MKILNYLKEDLFSVLVQTELISGLKQILEALEGLKRTDKEALLSAKRRVLLYYNLSPNYQQYVSSFFSAYVGPFKPQASLLSIYFFKANQ